MCPDICSRKPGCGALPRWLPSSFPSMLVTALTRALTQLLENRNRWLTPRCSSPGQAGPPGAGRASSQVLPAQLAPEPISSFLWDPTAPRTQFAPRACGCSFHTVVSPARLHAAFRPRTHLVYRYPWTLTQCLALRGRNSGVPKAEIFCGGKERKGLP